VITLKQCKICGSTNIVEEHHIIKGRGKRKACETEQSKVMLCYEHHRGTYGVHGKNGKELDMLLKLQLQATYYEMGKKEEDIRELMGGKLYLVNGEVYKGKTREVVA
jgi:hypothetical protein